MGVELMGLHGVYVLFIALIIGFMIFRKDTTPICLIGILLIGLAATGSVSQSVEGIFTSLIYAMKELLPTILVISIIVGMSHVLSLSGVSDTMISPVTKLIRSPAAAYWIIGIIMMIVSWFFWPSPAVALIGAVLLPAAIRVGLPAIGVAVAMNLFGHGIALSGDFVIQAAPTLTADAAGLPVGSVITASIPLVIVMGTVTTALAFWFLRSDLRRGVLKPASAMKSAVPGISGSSMKGIPLLPVRKRRTLAVLIPLLFLADITTMYAYRLQGGEATALIGGTAALILLLVAMLSHRQEGFGKSTSYLVDGFHFGFKVFGPVIPIAAFFYLGDAALLELFGNVLPAGSQGIVNDLGLALAHHVPVQPAVSAVTLTAVGAITGLDGSGFSGISLAGSVAHLFSAALGAGAETLTALGQVAAIWVGGGTLIPWALIPAAAICGVDPFDLARRNLKPVLIGLAVTTVVAIFLI
ncbi:hypothetical protein [Paenibacillus sp. FJAT-26967]|uniref:hypothetical protein n=1 Tax=Paenibacillus sp. FJAT-26967 TaxID=1729690 RepID=UPI0008395A93|nr:hypothetical protein [Paenibacillus sp. FJAT-26967]